MTAVASPLTGRNRALMRAAGLAVSAAALWLVLRTVDLAAVAAQLENADVPPLGLILLVIAAQLLLRAVRWRILLASMPNGRTVAVRALVPPLLIGYLGNAVLPARLGEPTRAYLVARREALPGAATFGTVVMERVLDTATLGLVALIAALAIDAPPWLVQLTGLAAVVGGTVLLVLTTPCSRLISTAIATLGQRAPARFAPILGFVRGVLDGAEGSGRHRAVALAAVISGVCWFGDAATFWLVGRAIGVSLAPGAALLIAAVTVLGTALPSAPGYLGTFELAASATAGVVGLPAAPGLALAVLAHAMTLLPLALGGVVTAVALGVSLGRLPRVEGPTGMAPVLPAGSPAGLEAPAPGEWPGRAHR